MFVFHIAECHIQHFGLPFMKLGIEWLWLSLSLCTGREATSRVHAAAGALGLCTAQREMSLCVARPMFLSGLRVPEL